jgi:hypothetical protein
VVRRIVCTSAAVAGLVVVLSAPAGASYPPKAVTCAVAPGAAQPGADVTVQGTNWKPGSPVSIGFLQDGVVPLGTAVTDAHGRFRTGARIPASAHDGRAQVAVTGTSSSGVDATCTSNFRVLTTRPAAANLPSTPSFAAGLTIAIGGIIAAALLIHRRRNGSLSAGSAK